MDYEDDSEDSCLLQLYAEEGKLFEVIAAMQNQNELRRLIERARICDREQEMALAILTEDLTKAALIMDAADAIDKPNNEEVYH